MSFLSQHPQLLLIQNLAKKRKANIYLVGGFLRDALLKQPGLDFDFAIDKNAIGFAKAFAQIIKGAFVLLDKEHGCARVVKKSAEGIETFDFADFRAATLDADLTHRDFTINTLVVDVKNLSSKTELKNVLLDKKNGLKDLAAKKIRMTSGKVFVEDPLRLLRAFSLQAELGFGIESKTLTRIKIEKDLIRRAASERVREEIFKILETPRAAETLQALDKIGLLPKIMPQITVMYGVKQGGYHHLDVWPHSLEVVVQFEKLLGEVSDHPEIGEYLKQTIGGNHSRAALIKLAAVVHDIGKPETRKKEPGGRTSFHGHEMVGQKITRIIAQQLKFSTDERIALEDMVRWHLRPGYLSNFKKPSDRSIFRYFRDTKKEAVSILLLSIADQRSTRGPWTTQEDIRHHEKICWRLLDQFFKKEKEEPVVRLLTGNDLIKKLKLKPSPLFGKILKEVEEAQATGKIQDQAGALQLAERIAKKEKK